MSYLNKVVGTLFLLVVLVFPSCQKVDQETLQEEYLNQKLENFEKFRWKVCIDQIEKKAEEKADSFFVELAKQKTHDSIPSPRFIPRPRRPQVSIPEDSTPLQPILSPPASPPRDSLIRDSLPQ